jgi:hypothetical protein
MNFHKAAPKGKTFLVPLFFAVAHRQRLNQLLMNQAQAENMTKNHNFRAERPSLFLLSAIMCNFVTYNFFMHFNNNCLIIYNSF